jgi:replicative DNA helicase
MAELKSPPHNDEAETSVLGAVLIDKDSIGLVSEILSPKDFYNDINGIIYDAMLSLYEERKPIDVITLAQRLKKTKNGDKVDSSFGKLCSDSSQYRALRRPCP